MILEKKQLKHFRKVLRNKQTILEKSKFPKTRGKSFNDFQVNLYYYLQTLKELREIETALLKIREGTYGFCIICGKKIDLERLEILPETEECVSCARKNG